jgi:hypothetical protein
MGLKSPYLAIRNESVLKLETYDRLNRKKSLQIGGKIQQDCHVLFA